ncbi:glutamine synthetase family protein [Candidatus Babeliales bacterium]|nr:glutamine synthetase family protein [Candidatus Babeliales bacterium]
MKKYFLSLALLLCSAASLPIKAIECESKIEQILQNLRSYNVQFVDITFCDPLGKLYEVTIPIGKLETALKNDMFFDGSSIKGYSDISASDLRLRIDIDSLSFSPWKAGQTSSVRFFCDIYDTDGTPYKKDPRHILKTVLQEAKDYGFDCFCGVELEFFLFKKDASNKTNLLPCDNDGYCQIETCAQKKAFKEMLLYALMQSGVDPEKIHHEVAIGQMEVVLSYNDPLVMAEKLLLAKHVITMFSEQNDYIATFMPKPITGANGTGMHIHASMKKNGINAFYDKTKHCFLSDDARCFISGLLKRVPEINILFNAEVNSYKRLVPGYEAPLYLCCGEKNRSAAIRIPEVCRENLETTQGAPVRIELRWGDAECNPYLAFAALFKAGIEGIKNKEPHVGFVTENLYHVDKNYLTERGIQTIPESLEEGIALFECSDFAKDLLGKTFHESYTTIKKNEWSDFLKNTKHYDPFIISGWEMKRGITLPFGFIN